MLSLMFIFSVFSILGFIFSLMALIEIKAMKQSTHNVQYVPTPLPDVKVDEDGFEELDDEAKEKLKDMFYV